MDQGLNSPTWILGVMDADEDGSLKSNKKGELILNLIDACVAIPSSNYPS